VNFSSGDQILVGENLAAFVFQLIRSQRAHRAFLPDPIPISHIELILTAATHAPSAENSQPWEFVVVSSSAKRAEIGALMLRAWEGGGRDASRDVLDPKLFNEVDHGLTGGVASAPVLIVCCADLRRTRSETVQSSMFPAIQNLLLTASAFGYGSALTTIATVFTSELRALLKLPREILPIAVIPIGVPAKALGPSKREPLSEHVHFEIWGNQDPSPSGPLN